MATAASILHRTVPGTQHGAWLKWTALVSAGQIAGFAVPLALGVIAARAWGLGGFALWGVIVAAGAAGGLVFGAAQAFALRSFLPRANSWLWIVATFVAATATWAFAWLVPTYHDRGEPIGIVAGIAILAIGVGFIALTVPQAEALSFAKVRFSSMWIAFSALAWSAALPLAVLPALFIGGSSSAAAVVGAFAIGGVAMAVTMAAITGWGMAWLAARNAPGA